MVNFMKSVFLSLQTPRAASPLFAALMVLASLPLTAPARATIASDDTQAVQAAVNAAIKANKPLIIPAGATYFLKGSIRISGPLTVHCQPRTKFLLDFDPNFDPHDAADAAAFSITSSNVTIDGCWFDGDNLGTNVLQPGSVGRMAIWLEGSSTKPLRNVIIENDTFTNLTQYGGTQPASLPASHAVYGTELDTFVYENNTVDNISGSALHIEACSNATVTGNNIHQTGWASIVFYGDCHFSSITNNTITGNGPDTRYWGGSIDVFSQDSTGLPPNSNIVIDGNYISGVHMYGAAIRVGSAQYITVTNNQLIDISSGSVDLVSGIGMTPRVMPATASSSCTTAPFANCANGRNMFYNIISGNTIESLGTNAIGIYIIGETIPLNQIVGNLGHALPREVLTRGARHHRLHRHLRLGLRGRLVRGPLHGQGVPGRAHLPALCATSGGARHLQGDRDRRGARAGLEGLPGRHAPGVGDRAGLHLRDPAHPGQPAARPRGLPGLVARARLQHRGELHHQHQLAELHGRADDELPLPDARPHLPPVPLGGDRHRACHRGDPGRGAAQRQDDRQLLRRYRPLHTLRPHPHRRGRHHHPGRKRLHPEPERLPASDRL